MASNTNPSQALLDAEAKSLELIKTLQDLKQKGDSLHKQEESYKLTMEEIKSLQMKVQDFISPLNKVVEQVSTFVKQVSPIVAFQKKVDELIPKMKFLQEVIEISEGEINDLEENFKQTKDSMAEFRNKTLEDRELIKVNLQEFSEHKERFLQALELADKIGEAFSSFEARSKGVQKSQEEFINSLSTIQFRFESTSNEVIQSLQGLGAAQYLERLEKIESEFSTMDATIKGWQNIIKGQYGNYSQQLNVQATQYKETKDEVISMRSFIAEEMANTDRTIKDFELNYFKNWDTLKKDLTEPLAEVNQHYQNLSKTTEARFYIAQKKTSAAFWIIVILLLILNLLPHVLPWVTGR